MTLRNLYSGGGLTENSVLILRYRFNETPSSGNVIRLELESVNTEETWRFKTVDEVLEQIRSLIDLQAAAQTSGTKH